MGDQTKEHGHHYKNIVCQKKSVEISALIGN